MAKIIINQDNVRSERVVVLMTPKTKKELEKLVLMHKSSLSSTIDNAVANYLETYQDDIQRYNAFFGEE